MKKTILIVALCLLSVMLLSTPPKPNRLDVDSAVETSTSLPSGNSYRFSPGETGSVTVASPYSLDGASASMWGFYKAPANAWVNTTYGTATITNGTAIINYAIPADYVSDFTWVIDVDYSPDFNYSSGIIYSDGLWGEFSYDDPNGTTVQMKAYGYDNYSVLSTGGRYRVSANSGAVFPDPDLAGSSVYVKVPWTGTWDEYLTPAIGYGNNPKTGLSPTYALNQGFTITEIDHHPLYPDYKKVRLAKPSIGFEVDLYGYKNTSGSDPLGYIYWVTLNTVYDIDAVFNTATNLYEFSFDTPLDLQTTYFLDPVVWEYTDTDYTDYYWITTGGGTDLLLSGSKPAAPVNNVTQNIGYNTIQAAVDAATAGDVIEVAAGNYDEHVIINKAISLLGPNANISAVDGTRVPEAVIGQYITVNNGAGISDVIIAGFEFNETDAWHSIIMIGGNTEDVQILNNRFINIPWKAIYTEAGANVTNLDMIISGNLISGVSGTSESGIYLINHTGGTISNNKIENTVYGGILLNTYCHGMTISNNQIYNVPQQGLQLSGDVANVTVSGNIIDHANTAEVSDKGGIRLYASDFTGQVLITGNSISNSYNGIAVKDGYGSLSPAQQAWIQIRNNDLSGNVCGVYMPADGSDYLDAEENWWGDPAGPTLRNGVGVTAHVLFDPWYIDDAEEGYEALSGDVDLFVDADYGLIQDNESQTYSVVVSEVADLLGFTVRVKVPIVDFVQPALTDIHMGAAFGDPMYQPFIFSSVDATHYIYDVSLANLQNEFVGGVDGPNLVLFTIDLTSLANRDNIFAGGCVVDIPIDNIVLRNHYNQTIPCDTATGFTVLIDATESTMVHNNAGVYSSGTLLNVLGDGSGDIDRPWLNFTFTDNYNLDDVLFLIQGERVDAPDAVEDFPAQYIVTDFDGTATTLDWQLDAQVNALDTGTYTVYYAVTDDAGNFQIYDWDFVIDVTATGPIVWDEVIPCRTTPKQNDSIDLKWTNPEGAVKNHIWYLSYASLPAASAYPEYAPASNYTITNDINPYAAGPSTLGWTKGPEIAAAGTYTWTPAERGYYYITVYVEDASGNLSAAPAVPFYRESISYWPGDVTGTADGMAHTVTSADISLLSGAWGTTAPVEGAWANNILDVGPTVDNARRSRPTPDNVINIEDLMIFAMNYNNTVYTFYPRDPDAPQIAPIRIEMLSRYENNELVVELSLAQNDGFVRALNIPIRFGTGLSFNSALQGEIWPTDSVLLSKLTDDTVELSISTLGYDTLVESNGLIAELRFAINAADTSLELLPMLARGADNEEIIIENNPTGPSEGEDPENVIPTVSYLGNCYPNPFNPTTNIQYGLKEAARVQVNVYNARGQLVKQLVNGTQPAGTYNLIWNGQDNDGRSVSSGIYFFRMITADKVQTKKAILMK